MNSLISKCLAEVSLSGSTTEACGISIAMESCHNRLLHHLSHSEGFSAWLLGLGLFKLSVSGVCAL